MKQAQFLAHCPFEIDDKVKIYLDKEEGVLSESTYVVRDILATHSVAKGTVSFELVVSDEFGRDLAKRNPSDFVRVTV